MKEVLDDFLTRRQGDRVGLIVFGNAAFVQAPFTQDLDAVRQLLGETAPRMAGPRTAMTPRYIGARAACSRDEP